MSGIITIGREFGSGGKEVGELVAKRTGAAFYDKEILTRAAEESGICEAVFRTHDEKGGISGLFTGGGGASSALGSPLTLQMPLNQRVFLAQFDAITKLAAEGHCVIVGRCADYVLKDVKGVTHVFVYAAVEKRIERIMRVYSLGYDEAKELVRKTDKQRKSYYNFFADGNWGLRCNYDLMLRSDNRDPEELADIIVKYAELNTAR